MINEIKFSDKKADAMIARRARREKARVLHRWQRLHAECTSQQQEGRVTAAAAKALGKVQRTRMDGSPRVSGPHYLSGGSVLHFSRSSSRSSLFSISTSSSSEMLSLGAVNKGERAAARTLSPARAKPPFPVPSAEEAVRAGRANVSACFRAELKRTCSKEDGKVAMASVAVAAGKVREALSGEPGVRCFYTPEMQAMAQFGLVKRTHEEKNIRAIYGLE